MQYIAHGVFQTLTYDDFEHSQAVLGIEHRAFGAKYCGNGETLEFYECLEADLHGIQTVASVWKSNSQIHLTLVRSVLVTLRAPIKQLFINIVYVNVQHTETYSGKLLCWSLGQSELHDAYNKDTKT